MRRLSMLWFVFLLLLLCPVGKGEEVSSLDGVIAQQGIPEVDRLFDGDLESAQHCTEKAWVSLHRQEGIGSIYLIFNRDCDFLTLTDEEAQWSVVQSTNKMLHCFVDLEQVFGYLPSSVRVTFPAGGVWINELGVFSPGALPDWVQQWQRIPEGEADLLLLSTHGDDEQLFFAGLLPWYAGEQKKRVQVVYFTDHRNLTSIRVHEMLNGLWAVGVRDYPVFGPFPDYYTFDLEDAYRYYERIGYPRRELLSFVVRQLRFYQPLVAVGHDQAGEYGHGMHQLTADLLKEAVTLSAQAEAYPEWTEQYGVWQVPKTYLHLYPENPIVMDWDIPMEAFGGMSAYEVTKERGFPCHESQQRDFAWYFRGMARADEVDQYSPCRYGLFQTTVGVDTGAGDFFEHLEDYRPQPTVPQPVEVTQPTAQAAPPVAQLPPPERQPEEPGRLRSWIILPALGTLVLVLLTAFLSAPDSREKI